MKQARQGALIGYGFIGANGHFPVYVERFAQRRDFAITAIADICPARREAARRAAPWASIYPSYEELLKAEAGRIEFVDIAAPPYCHAEIALMAMDRGFHVLCEKPLALSLAEAEAMRDRAKARRRVLFPCHNYKYAPVIAAVRDLIEKGAIGRIHMATLQTFRPTHARGVPEWRPDWRRNRRFAGGGIGMDHGPHSLYLAFEWLASYPIAVTAATFGSAAWGTEDHFSSVLTFPTGVATVHLTWTAATRKVLYSLHGERGAIIVDDDEVRLLPINAPEPSNDATPPDLAVPSSHWMDASHREWFGRVLDQFDEAIEAKAFAGRDLSDAVECMRVIEAAYESALNGSMHVSLNESRGAA